MATMKDYDTSMKHESSEELLETLSEKVEEIEDVIECAMKTENGGNDMGMGYGVSNNDIATLGLAGAIGYGGYGYNHGGYGTVSNMFLAEQNKEINRDVNKGFCDTNARTADGFAFQNLNEANRNTDTRELITSANQGVKDTVLAESRHIGSAVTFNERLTNEVARNIQSNLAAMELRFERRGDRVDDKLCHIDKEQAVAAAVACERDKHINYKLDTMLSRTATDDVINAQLSKFQSINGCQPVLSSCGQ